jgi:Plavaka transposase
MSHQDNVVHDMEYQAMDQDLSPPSFPLPLSTPPLPSSFPQPPPPQFTQTGRLKRNYRLPARYEDVNPEPLRPLEEEEEQPTAALPRLLLIVRNRLRTATNAFSLLREYLYRPSFDPDSFVHEEDLYRVGGTDPVFIPPPSPPPSPVHRNKSVEMLMNWKDSGTSTKSDAEVNRLVNSVLLDPNFKLEDLKGFNVARENQRSDAAEKKSPFFDSFQTADINIEVPSGTSGIPPASFSVPGLVYRKLTAVIQAAFSSPLASHFHLSPFKLFHRSPSGEEERVFSEVYNSDAFIEEHDNVQRAPLPPDQPDCKLEKVVVALMVWSDSTHLANFGTAKLWPIYLLFGNVSKYIHGQPNSGACQHVAYIPSLPDSFQDFAASFCSKWGTQKRDLLTHCRRELMHGVWKFLLDADFIHAYKYGMVVKCADGIERRVYPRFFTYSADYPEK